MKALWYEIIDYCKHNLAKYKVPKHVEFVNDFPKRAIGKILRKELRRMEMARRQRAERNPEVK